MLKKNLILKKFNIKYILFWLVFFCLPTFAYKDIILENINWKPVNVIKVVLDWNHYVVSSLSLSWNTLEELTTKVGWDTSVNWVFFCPADYSWCNNTNSTVFERVYKWDAKSYSTFWPDTGIRGVFGFDKFWNPLFAQNNLTMNGLGYNTNFDKMDQIYFGLSNFPVLLINWEDVVFRSTEFMDKKMATRGTKSFICSTEDTTTIYLWSVWWVNLFELGPFIKKAFWCFTAINLDAWASLWMVYDGRVITRWSRRQIMDAFVVLTRDQYEKLTGLIPPIKNVVITGSINHTLSQKDLDFVDLIYHSIHKASLSTKNKAKTTIRKLLSSNSAKTNPRTYTLLKEILLRVYTVDRL